MTDIFRAVITEPSSATPAQYARRVRLLGAIYLTLFTVSIAGLVLLTWRGQLFVTLAQRSNVETLVLAFFFVFFSYIALISAPGALGALRLFWHFASNLWIRDWIAVERHKMKAIGPSKGTRLEVALNLRVHPAGGGDEAIEIPVGDEAGRVGVLRFDGARCSFLPDFNHTSNNVFVYVEHQLNEILRSSGREESIDVLAWKSIDDEQAETMFALVKFARNLERVLGAAELWPRVTLSDREIADLGARLSLICRSLRSECFLPDWEYTAEHKVPIIPEPLGLVSIGRAQRRADPLASMGLAAGVVIVVVGILALFIVLPPWVPG